MQRSPTARICLTLACAAALGACSVANLNGAARPAPAQAYHAGTLQCQPDFTLSITPTAASITAGQTVLMGFGMSSVCGLAGTINVGVTSISPQPGTVCTGHGSKKTCTTNGPTHQQCCYDFPLKAGGSTGNHMTFGATSATVKTTYTITIRAEDITGGCCYGLTHTATFTLTVT